MSRRCTTCRQTRGVLFFQPSVATTDESRLLQTCSTCQDKNRRAREQHQRRSTALTESNLLSASENTSDICPLLPPPCRQRRVSIDSDTSFQHEYGPTTKRTVLDASSIPQGFNHPLNATHRTKRLDLRRMTYQCLHCYALHWPSERDRESSLNSPTFQKCCKVGIVPLTLFQDPPRIL